MTQPQVQPAAAIPDWLANGDPNEYLAVTFTRGEVVQLLQLLPHLRKMPTLVDVVKTLRDTMPALQEQGRQLAEQVASVAPSSGVSIDDFNGFAASMQEQLEAIQEAVKALSAAPKRSRAEAKPVVAEPAFVIPAVVPAEAPVAAMPVATPVATPVSAMPVPTAMPVPAAVAPVAVAPVAEVPVEAIAVPPSIAAVPVPQVGANLAAEAGKTPADAADIVAIQAKIAALSIGAGAAL